MPVRFRCSVCRKKLSVTRRKIGEQVKCPNCSSYIEVPGKTQTAPSTLPRIKFSEAPGSQTPPVFSAIESEESSSQTAEDETERLDESQGTQQWETPPEGTPSRTAAEDDEQVRADARKAMWTRPAGASGEPAPPIQFRRAASEFEEMDLTPMVDVTFLLLIFFMITASFTLEKTIPTPVPDPKEQSAAQPIQQQEDLLEKSIMIGIESDNTITIDQEPIPNPEMLRDRLTDLMLRDQKAEVLVTVADLAMQETVVYVLDTANDVGMQKIRLASASSEAD